MNSLINNASRVGGQETDPSMTAVGLVRYLRRAVLTFFFARLLFPHTRGAWTRQRTCETPCLVASRPQPHHAGSFSAAKPQGGSSRAAP